MFCPLVSVTLYHTHPTKCIKLNKNVDPQTYLKRFCRLWATYFVMFLDKENSILPRMQENIEYKSEWSMKQLRNAFVNVFVKPARRENCHSKVRTLGIAFPLLMVFQANQDCCKRSAISALDNWGIGAPSRLCRRLACDKYIDAKALNVALVTPKLSDNHSKTSTSTHHNICSQAPAALANPRRKSRRT